MSGVLEQREEEKKSGNAMGGAMSGNGGGELDMTQK